MINPGERSSSRSTSGPSLQPVEQMSAGECLDELAADPDLDRLRALVGARRMLLEMEKQTITGQLECDLVQGRVLRWRYPRTLDVRRRRE